jgi:hypothetical protein
MRLIAFIASSAMLPTMLSACYTYRPLSTRAPEPGLVVRAELTDDGTESLGRLLGANTGAVEGRVVSADSQAVTLSVMQTTNRAGIDNYWKGERVALPRTGIATMQTKALSRRRTAVVTVGAVAALVAAWIGFDIGGGSDTRVRPGPRPQ